MPSPIAHCSLTFALWPATKRCLPSGLSSRRRSLIGVGVLACLMAPDVDVAVGVLSGKGMAYYHNGATHSIAFSLLVGVVFAGAGRWTCGTAFSRMFWIGSVACLSHVALDAMTFGRGVELFWPITEARVQTPIPMFLGVRHSVGAPWTTHLLTAANDCAFAALVWGVCRFARRQRLNATRDRS